MKQRMKEWRNKRKNGRKNEWKNGQMNKHQTISKQKASSPQKSTVNLANHQTCRVPYTLQTTWHETKDIVTFLWEIHSITSPAMKRFYSDKINKSWKYQLQKKIVIGQSYITKHFVRQKKGSY